MSECWDTNFEEMTFRNICVYSLNGVSYTRHYKNQLRDRKLPRIPNVWELLNGKVIEVEIINGRVTKALIRTRYSIDYSIITVIRFEDSSIIYITGWMNNINDNHETLDKSKYVKKEVEECV